VSKTYLFIDDEADSKASTEPYADEITEASEGSLVIESYRPSSIQEVLETIAKSKPDGLLVDVAFTNALTQEHAPLSYDGIALAQQVRTLQTRGLRHGDSSLPEFPLIRFSKADVILEYVSGDTTSEDLFDEKIDKAKTLDDPEPVAKRLLSLATDYPVIAKFAAGEKSEQAVAQLLGSDVDFLGRIDARALLGLKRPDAPAHVLSRYLTGPFLGRPGPIIDEGLLAVRLGVDRKQSPDWLGLRDKLKPAAYVGVFASGYERWWMALVTDWWAAEIDADRALFRLGAADRVRSLVEKTGLTKLTPLAEDPDSPGTKFWHLCLRSKRPVDPGFGFPLLPEWGQETWHDVDYLCQEEALRDPRNPRLGRAERTRLAKLRKGET
jgi:hypothetical protein